MPMIRRHREPANRARAEQEEDATGHEHGDVRVEDRRQRLVESGVDRRPGRGPDLQLLADALVDQDVRVHRRADGQHDARDAGQRQRGAEQPQERDDHHDVRQQHDVGDQAENPVVNDHEGEQHEPRDHERARAVADVVLADARPDHALLDDDDRRRERAGAQQLGELGALRRRQAGDLEVVGEHAADRRDADDLLLRAVQRDLAAVALDQLALLLDEHDRHRAVQVLASRAQHLLAAAAVERDRYRRLALRGREAGVDQLLAGRDHVALQQHRRCRRAACTGGCRAARGRCAAPRAGC